MNGWAEGIQSAIHYIEDNLTEKLDIADIAAKAYVSEFHFQRIFSVLCGFTVGEYIRCRRLTLAGEELSRGDVSVIDTAVKYGYNSPDSFTRAFTRFHGISPCAAKEEGVHLKAFAPLKIKLTLEGGTMTEYKIVEKEAFTVVGKVRKFSMENSYTEIPKYWEEHMSGPDKDRLCGMFGVCLETGGSDFEYMIADILKDGDTVPEGFVTREIPAGTWAVFPCTLKNLQSVNTAIWSEWLPNCREYKLAGNYNVEAYYPIPENGSEMPCEIWVPVEKL